MATTTRRTYCCGQCGRELKNEHWIYSRFTGARYCWPGEGCATKREFDKRMARAAKHHAERERAEQQS